MGGTRGGVAAGAALILGGMAVLGFTDNFMRLIADEAGLWQFHLMRSAMALALLAAAAAALGLGMVPKQPGAVAARSGALAAAMLLYFGAMPLMPLAQVAAALFTAPIWVLLFSAAFFGRPIGSRRAAAAALGFAGALAMLRPDPANLSAATLMPLAAGALYGLSNLLTRERCADEPVGALLASFFAALAIASVVALAVLARVEPPAAWVEAAPFLTAPWRPLSGALAFWVFVQAAGAVVAVAMVARGYQTGDTAALAVFEYGYLLAVAFWGWALWGDALGAVDAVGIAMIVASGAIIALTPAPAGGLARP
jgi:drug/metabolite transporter (DMT)-like permease